MTKILLELSVLEAAHLTDLVTQFTELVSESVASEQTSPVDDPAIARLVPDAYRDDDEAAGEFRRLTQSELLGRRHDDAGTVLATLRRDGHPLSPATVSSADAETAFVVELDGDAVSAWLRTLTSVRLVMATRLGILHDDADIDSDDARLGVYEWLGFRLEGLLQALED